MNKTTVAKTRDDLTDDAMALLKTIEWDEAHRLLGWIANRDPQLVIDTINAMHRFDRANQFGA